MASFVSTCALALFVSASPKAAPDTVRLYAPTLEGLSPVYNFLAQAGKSAASLQPEPYVELLHPLIFLPLAEPSRMEELGIPKSSPLSVTLGNDGQVSCLLLPPPGGHGAPDHAAQFAQDARSRLSLMGPLKETKTPGVKGTRAEVDGKTLGAFAVRGQTACAAKGANAEKAAGDASKSPPAAPKVKSSSGTPALIVQAAAGDAFVSASGQTLKLEAVPNKTLFALPSFAPAGESPFRIPEEPGLFSLRGRLDAVGLKGALGHARRQLSALCSGCQAGPLLERLAPLLTGDVLLHVSQARARGGLRSNTDRYLSVRHAVLLTLKGSSEKAVTAWLDQAAKQPGVERTKDGLRLALPGGFLTAGVRQNQLYVANDEGALEGAWKAVSPSPRAHGAEWKVGAPAVARALGSVSLLDVMAEPRLAGLLGAALELGPLFARTTRLEGAVNTPAKGGASRLTADWTLEAAPTR